MMVQPNEDSPYRLYRFVEVLADRELKRQRSTWSLVDGWLELAEAREPGTPKALVEGEWILRLPDGVTFKEVSFKLEHRCVGDALPDWAAGAGRRWARYEQGSLHISDGQFISLSALELTKV